MNMNVKNNGKPHPVAFETNLKCKCKQVMIVRNSSEQASGIKVQYCFGTRADVFCHSRTQFAFGCIES